MLFDSAYQGAWTLIWVACARSASSLLPIQGRASISVVMSSSGLPNGMSSTFSVRNSTSASRSASAARRMTDLATAVW